MADSEPSQKPKRRLRVPAPTIRERAEQAQQAAAQPPKTRRVKVVTDTAGKQLGVMGRLFRHQPFRSIDKVLRVVGRILLPAYFRGSYRELRQVTWLKWRESRRLTFAVLAFAIVFGALVALVDYGFDKLFKAILVK